MTLVYNIDRRSFTPIGDEQYHPCDVLDAIRNRMDGADYVIMKSDTITPPDWPSRVACLSDEVDIAFLSDSPPCSSAPMKIDTGIYRATKLGCTQAMYISGRYHSKISSKEDIMSKIEYDIYHGNVVAVKFHPQLVTCDISTTHNTRERELQGLVSLERRKVYIGYVSLIVAVLLIIALGNALFWIDSMRDKKQR